MQTHVYANDREIACQAAGSDGKSPAAFPDPCWSPPAPAAGPIVIPYPNTCEATHITHGTSTVFICGKQVAIADQSFFSTSTGDEGATQAFTKGVATSVIKGKAYFTQWSSNVIFEGYGVPRHLDLVSHNHGSMPSNTPVFPYLSRATVGRDCGAEKKRIDRACAPEKDHSEARKNVKKQSKLHQLLQSKRKPAPGGKGSKWHWTDDHCDGLEHKLASLEDAKEYVKKMEDAVKQLPHELNILGAAEQQLKDMAIHAGEKAAAKWTAKAGLKQLVGSELPLIGNVAMGIWSAVDGLQAMGNVAEIRAVATESLEQLDMLRNKLTDVQRLGQEFENFSKLSPEEQLAKAQKVGAEGQDVLATVNECTRARKCQLTPYDADGVNQRGREHSNNKGCCKGQTGHHLIYGAMMEGACPGYSTHPPNDQMHKDAPTVCVEGTNQNVGSHGRVHNKMDEQVADLVKKGKAPGGSMSMDDTLTAAAKSHKEAFPFSRCSEKCIRSQLESFYKDKCPNARPKAIDKFGNPPKTGRGTVDD